MANKKAGRISVVGAAVLIRTVTHYYTGRIVFADKDVLVLEEAAWIADTGRFGDALMNGTLNEVEPFPRGCEISRGAIVDVSPWKGALPRAHK